MTTSSRPDASRNASPYLYGGEAQAVAQVLDTGQYGHTEVTEEFERQVAAFLGVPDAVAVSSGTAALHTALSSLGVGPGDQVVVPSLTFCATVQAILATGAEPVFVEVDPATLCTTADLVREAVTDATKAVLPVLFGGRAVDLAPLGGFLAERGIAVVEDAAHAFGSFDGVRRVGATGTLTCFSFGPIKNLTCGQGGAVIPRTGEEAEQLRRFRLLGVVQSQAERAIVTSYRVEGVGRRYQLSAINAAIGLAQLPHFATTQDARRRLWAAYRDALAGLDGVSLVDVDVERSLPHLCQVRVPGRDEVFHAMRDQGVAVGVHYPPNHQQPAFARWHQPLPVTEQLGREILSLPFHQHLDEHDVDQVATALRRALSAGGRT
ncbi:DegT/DnrJ/EryC1/StrS family aminotransferase [Streptomyces sp. NPDC056987]|uniref:DegT/DnrJ/EryC1/StrS family aminotransferase n=1 Tax=Streptomyces sp. NPDC056987 TaxID=3345988 RepID=UPI0036307CFC